MATRPDPDEDDTLELTEDMKAPEGGEPPEDEPEEGDEVEAEDPDEVEPEDPDAVEGDEETEIGFADDTEAKEGDSSVIRRLRERAKDLARENAELRKAQPAAPAEDPGPKPTFSECGYDEEKYEAAIDGWKAKTARIDADKAERHRQAEAAERDWQRDLEGYEQRRQALGKTDFEEAAETVKANLNLMQQAVIIKAANDSATFIYALSRSDERLAELAKIQDPVKLAAAVARMEGGVKVVRKRKAPAPDRPATGSAKLPGGVDKQLEKLESEAERTGDRTALIRYKTKLAERGKKRA